MTTITMTPAESALIKEFGYDEANKELHVTFSDGAGYKYSGVTPEDHAAFVAAPSKGKHFLAHVKGKFTHTRKDK